MWDFREVWTMMAQRVEFFSIPRCGHLPHEEKPDEVNRELVRFLEPWRASFGDGRAMEIDGGQSPKSWSKRLFAAGGPPAFFAGAAGSNSSQKLPASTSRTYSVVALKQWLCAAGL